MPDDFLTPETRGALNALRHHPTMSPEQSSAMLAMIELFRSAGVTSAAELRASDARKLRTLKDQYDAATAAANRTIPTSAAALAVARLSLRSHPKGNAMPNSYLSKMYAERDRLHGELRAAVDSAGTRQTLTESETAAVRALQDDYDAIARRIEDIEDGEARAKSVEAHMADIAKRPTERGHGADSATGEALRDAIRTRSLAPIDIRWDDAPSGVNTRALTTSGNVGVTFYSRLVRHLTEASAILSAGATLLVTDTGEPLKVPKTTADSAATIAAEGATIATSDPTLGTVQLGAYKYSFLTSISRELAEDVGFDLEDYLAAQAGDALGNGFGAHLIAGDGSSKPTGVLASASTGVTGGTGVAGAFTADNLIDLYHSLASPYARSTSAAWIMRNSTLAAVRKLKDSQNRYLFNVDIPTGYPGAAGQLLGRPVFVDPNVPAVGLGAKSVLFGDMSKVWVRHVNGVRFERSLEHGFDTDMVWFKAVLRADGALIDTTGAVKVFIGGAS